MRPIIQVVAEEVDYNAGFGFSIRNAVWAIRSLHFPMQATVDVLFAFEIEKSDSGRELPYVIRFVAPDGSSVDAISKVQTVPFEEPGKPFVFAINERLALTVNPGQHEFQLLFDGEEEPSASARILFEPYTP